MVASPRLLIASGFFIVAASFIPDRAKAQQQKYSEERNADVPVAGARGVRIDARAGSLRVEGRSGLTQVRVKGVARSNQRGRLADIRLIAERRGNDIYIKADIPESNGDDWRFGDGPQMALDLVIEVPMTLPLEVDDSSGEALFLNTGRLTLDDASGAIEVRGSHGSVEIEDGSGEIEIDGVEGDVIVSDGSGEISIANVTGDVTIEDDGSGSIDVAGVGGTFRVGSDGSGDIDVGRVAGDFVVDSDGSGGIKYSDVKGRVQIPERRRRRS